MSEVGAKNSINTKYPSSTALVTEAIGEEG